MRFPKAFAVYILIYMNILCSSECRGWRSAAYREDKPSSHGSLFMHSFKRRSAIGEQARLATCAM